MNFSLTNFRAPLAVVLLAGAAILPTLAQTGKGGTTMAGDARYLPKSDFTIKSALRVDMDHNTGTLPLHKGICNGQTVWYVITDASDAAAARDPGVNFAPRGSGLQLVADTLTEGTILPAPALNRDQKSSIHGGISN